MEKYKNDYKVYYDEIIKKVNKGTKAKESYQNTSQEIYPKTSYKAGPYSYNRGTVKSSKGSFKIGYINRLVIRLILTFVIFLGAFSLKILDNKEAKVLYNKGKDIVNKSYGLENIENIEKTLKNLNIDYKEFVSSIGAKYEKAINDIKVFNTED